MPLWGNNPPEIVYKTTTRVIVVKEPRLPEEKIQKALAGNAGAPWYQAIVAKIEGYRDEYLDTGRMGVKTNNNNLMAGGLAVHGALTELLADLDLCVNADATE